MTQTYQPQPQPPPQPEPKSRNWFQRNIGWKLAVLLAVAVLASCVAIINGPTAPDRDAPPPPSTDIEVADSEGPEPEPESEPTQETVEVGEKVRDGGY